MSTSICPSAHASQEPHKQASSTIPCMLPIAVAQFFTDSAAICYVIFGFVDNFTFANNGQECVMQKGHSDPRDGTHSTWIIMDSARLGAGSDVCDCLVCYLVGDIILFHFIHWPPKEGITFLLYWLPKPKLIKSIIKENKKANRMVI